ncbi:MAG: nucleoside-diphosphate kinase [Thermoguttaceae bacterium]
MSDSNAVERTFVMLKPDALERGLIGEIISRLERKGLKPVRFLWRAVSPELAAKHYERLTSKPFYPLLEAYITRGPVLASIWEGRDAVAVVRRLVGATDPALAEAGTIRGDFGLDVTENLIHASDSPEAVEREIGLFFD